jgi:SEC-C motif-containing protein
MRSRYTAYTLEKVDYVLETHHPDRRHEVDREGAARWSREAEWLGLEVRRIERGEGHDEQGTVEFIARYRLNGTDYAHHECAEFARMHGRWYYLDGEMVKQRPVVRDAPKIGRNESCPCGSGRKYKKCCGLQQ